MGSVLPAPRRVEALREGMQADDRLRSEVIDRLFAAVLSLETPEECYAYFQDLCTVGELHAIGQRFAVAERLAAGEHYQEIQAETGASTATISRVKRSLEYGADGYRLVIERLRDREKDRKKG